MGFPQKVGKINLLNNEGFIASLVDNEKLDLRIFVKNDSYAGATKRSFRFYLFDNNWTEFKNLINKVDKVHNEIG